MVLLVVIAQQVTDNYVGGLYYNATPTAWVYTADESRPAVSDQRTYNGTLNMTFQLSQKNRLSVFGSYEKMCLRHFSVSPTVAPEAATHNPGDTSIIQARYTSTLTSRLLFEAGVSHYLQLVPAHAAAGCDRALDPRSVHEPALPLGRNVFPDAADGGRLPRVAGLCDGREQHQDRVHIPVASTPRTPRCMPSAT